MKSEQSVKGKKYILLVQYDIDNIGNKVRRLVKLRYES